MGIKIYENEGYNLMGAAFEVYNERGFGMAEEIYQEFLEIELEIREMPFLSKAPLQCYYKGRLLKKHYEPDLFVDEKIVAELKAVSKLLPEYEV